MSGARACLDPRRPRLTKLLAENGRISAVIDFGCLGMGGPCLRRDGRMEGSFRRHPRTSSGRTLGRRRDVGAESRLGALETNPVLVREAQRWMDEVLADLDSTSERAVRD